MLTIATNQSLFILITITSSTVSIVVIIVIVIIVIATSITVYWRKKKRQQYEVGGKKGSCYKVIFHVILYIVDQKAITDNPAYEEGKLYCVISLCITSLYIYIVHVVEMRSRRVELETNPSYTIVQPTRTCSADYENVAASSSQ